MKLILIATLLDATVAHLGMSLTHGDGVTGPIKSRDQVAKGVCYLCAGGLHTLHSVVPISSAISCLWLEKRAVAVCRK